jgi:NAD(P)-dependent dehydrogenase (short-subunit alcohol dehydrogenase family)
VPSHVFGHLPAAHLAARTLAPRGLLAFTGAASIAMMQPTPGMLAYGTAKAAVSHIHRSMSAPGTLPKDAKCVLIAPYVVVSIVSYPD